MGWCQEDQPAGSARQSYNLMILIEEQEINNMIINGKSYQDMPGLSNHIVLDVVAREI